MKKPLKRIKMTIAPGARARASFSCGTAAEMAVPKAAAAEASRKNMKTKVKKFLAPGFSPTYEKQSHFV